MKRKLYIHESANAVAEAFADYLERLIEKKSLNIALSGGSTPKLLFLELSKRNQIKWDNVHLFWVDERCVPQDNDESNYRMAKELLIDNVGVPLSNVHRIKGESEPSKEAIRYENEIKQFVRREGNLPSFDLIILGIGTDGHIASIFPHQMELLKTEKICEVATHPISGQKRVSLTGRVIGNAQKVSFMVTGQAKSPIIKSILKDEEDAKLYPAAHIKSKEVVTWCIDSAAGSLL